MELRGWLVVLLVCTTAVVGTGFDAPKDLSAVENEVRKVAAEIDTLHQTNTDAALDAQATGDDHDEQPEELANTEEQSDPVAELEEADDTSDAHIQQLDVETASVQSDDTRNDMTQEASSEGFEHAPPEDTARAFQLAEGLKQEDLLPPGWVEKTDQKTGKCYYENLEAGKTTWDPPRSLVSIALAAARGQRDSQTRIEMLQSKLEEMSSSRDLGESANNGCGDMKSAQEAMQTAAESKMKQVLSSLAKDLNLTGEQQQLLDTNMKSLTLPSFAPPTVSAKAKVADDTKAPQKEKDTSEHNDLGESVSTASTATTAQDDEDVKDKIAMDNAESLARKIAQESAMKEAAQLHHDGAQLREEVMKASQQKEIQLQAEDDELEKASTAEDKMAAEIMGPKASKAERLEERILTGEVPTNINSDTYETENDEVAFDGLDDAPTKM